MYPLARDRVKGVEYRYVNNWKKVFGRDLSASPECDSYVGPRWWAPGGGIHWHKTLRLCILEGILEGTVCTLLYYWVDAQMLIDSPG